MEERRDGPGKGAAQAVGETGGAEAVPGTAGIPDGGIGLGLGPGLGQHLGELLAPGIFHIQGQGVGQVFFEERRGLFRRIEEVEALFSATDR